MRRIDNVCIVSDEAKAMFAAAIPALVGAVFCATAAAADIAGQVLGGGGPIADSTVTLFAASAGNPQELAQARTGADGRFSITLPGTAGRGASLYLVAQRGRPAASKANGDNSRIALMTVLGASPPGRVTINEMTTVAS